MLIFTPLFLPRIQTMLATLKSNKIIIHYDFKDYRDLNELFFYLFLKCMIVYLGWSLSAVNIVAHGERSLF